MKHELYVLGLGANLGTPLASLRVAAAALAHQSDIEVLAHSSVYRSEAVGPPQPDYLNAAVAVRTPLSAPSLLARLQAIERAFGRRRGVRWGARSLDLDLLWSTTEVNSPTLQIPHPRLRERWWALQPMLEALAGASGVGCDDTLLGQLEAAQAQLVHTLSRLGGRRPALAGLSERYPAELTTVSLREDRGCLRFFIRRRWPFEEPADLLMSCHGALWFRLTAGAVRPTEGARPQVYASAKPDLEAVVRDHLALLSRGRWPVSATICSGDAAPLRIRALTVHSAPRWLDLTGWEARSEGLELHLRHRP